MIPPPPSTVLTLITLFLLLTLTKCHPTVRDMEAPQIPGTFTNIPLAPDIGYCPDALRFAQVEPLQSFNGVLYVLPHQFITIPLNGGGVITCQAQEVTDSDVTTTSATVLRRDTQLDTESLEGFDLVRQLVLSQEEFFVGFEVGERTCGQLTVAAETVSIWFAPRSSFTANLGGVSVKFTPQYKYIYYYPESRPCLFQGNAAERGEIKQVPSRTPTPTPDPSASPTDPQASPIPTSTALATPSPNGPVGFPSQDPLPAQSSVTEVGRAVCFPADAVVWGRKGLLRMDAAKIGDELLAEVKWSGNGVQKVYSKVFAITHADAKSWYAFVTLTTESNHSVTLTEGHYVFANGQALRAGQVRIGDMMTDENGMKTKVVDIRRRIAQGLYSVQTECGSIVVDGLIVTAYSSVLGSVEAAHAALSPIRAIGGVGVRWFDLLRQAWETSRYVRYI